MNAAATLAPLSGATARPSPPWPPLVLIDGEARPDLSVVEIDAAGPLDERTAAFTIARSRSGLDGEVRSALARLRGSRVVVVQPVALACGSSRLIPLFDGRITGTRQRTAAASDEVELLATDSWSITLEARIDRSIAPADRTLGECVAAISTIGDLRLSSESLPPMVRDARSPARIDPGHTLGPALRALCDAAGIRVDRQAAWSDHRVIERRSLRWIEHGRPIRLALPELANPGGAVASIRTHADAAGPTKLELRADGQVVESTFTLIPGWGGGDTDLADAEYARSTASDFDAVASVFRLWVLNEDGAAGSPTFDLTAFFADGRAIPPQPLRLGEALTRDSGGRSVGVVVESSDDGGAAWSRFAGRVVVLADRAGVYLDDDALPPGWLAAVRIGDARLRVTATLRSPLPLTATRWIGNPFTGEFRHRVIRAGDAFAYRRIAASSRFAADVAAGIRTADAADDRDAMTTWLATHASSADASHGRASIDLIGIVPALRLGDRVERLAGRPVGIDAGDPRVGRTPVTVARILRRFDRCSTRIECDIR